MGMTREYNHFHPILQQKEWKNRKELRDIVLLNESRVMAVRVVVRQFGAAWASSHAHDAPNCRKDQKSHFCISVL